MHIVTFNRQGLHWHLEANLIGRGDVSPVRGWIEGRIWAGYDLCVIILIPFRFVFTFGVLFRRLMLSIVGLDTFQKNKGLWPRCVQQGLHDQWMGEVGCKDLETVDCLLAGLQVIDVNPNSIDNRPTAWAFEEVIMIDISLEKIDEAILAGSLVPLVAAWHYWAIRVGVHAYEAVVGIGYWDIDSHWDMDRHWDIGYIDIHWSIGNRHRVG